MSQDFSEVWQEAKSVAQEAYNKTAPQPMRVRDGKEVFTIAEGLCGFAWLWLPKASTPFVRWMKANGIGRKPYGTGYTIWPSHLINDYSQSIERKEKAMHAVSMVLRKHGIDAYMDSRLD